MTKPVEVSKILFAMELADITEDIAPWAEYMCEQTGGELHVIHVVPKMDYFAVPYATDPAIMDDNEKLLQRARQQVHDACEKYLESAPAKIHAVIGNPWEEIVNTVKAEKISMVVMGTHGRRGFERMLFGSVVEKVLRFSPVPVFCVHPVAE